MDLTNISTIAILALILGFSSLLQGAVGFGYAIFSIPIIVWLGLDLSSTVSLIAVSVLTQTITATYQLRADVRWSKVWLATLNRSLVLPFGILILQIFNNLDTDLLKQLLGILLLLILVVQYFWKVEPVEKLHLGWAVLAFSLSGLMQGMVSMGGPPVVLWVMAHRWSNQETRAFLFALFLLGFPLHAVLLYASFGQAVILPMIVGLLLSPIIAAGSMVGVMVGNRVSKERLRQVAFSFLLVIALSSIIGPMWQVN